MTSQLVEQRERLVQAERVAAWRELARRLAHELNNPLFPLQLTVENMVRARHLPQEQCDEIFEEGTATLMAEIANLKTIIARFSDFSKMPKPQESNLDVREVMQRVLALFAPTLDQREQPIALKTQIAADPLMVSADAELLHRALSNLVLNAIDAMPDGGTLTAVAARKTRCRPDQNLRYRHRAHSGRVPAVVYALLHHQTAWHRSRPGDCAIRRRRSSWNHHRREHPGQRGDVCH